MILYTVSICWAGVLLVLGELNSRVSCLLTRLLSLAGQVALQQLVHMEVTVLGELKRRNTMQEDKQRKKTKVMWFLYKIIESAKIIAVYPLI